VPGKPIRLLPNEPQTFKLLDPYADSCERYDSDRPSLKPVENPPMPNRRWCKAGQKTRGESPDVK
jgi:hypothetical protein